MTILGFVKWIAATLTLLLPLTSAAVVSCVNNSAQLNAALILAAQNSELDEIRIRQGNYEAPTGGFRYGDDDNTDLLISGGWNGLGASCTIQTVDPFNTVIDGLDTYPALRIKPGLTANYTISNLFLFNGRSESAGGGGLHFVTLPTPFFSGNVTLDHLALIGNSTVLSQFGRASALYFVNPVNTIRISNSVFAINEEIAPTPSAYAIYLDIINGNGLYFTNNTVVRNTGRGARIFARQNASAFVANNIFWDNSDGRGLLLSYDGVGRVWFLNNSIDKLSASGIDVDAENVSIEPQFQSGFFNFSLIPTSPLVDAGRVKPTIVGVPPNFNESWSVGELDFSGASRVQGLTVDIGALETTSDSVFFDSFE